MRAFFQRLFRRARGGGGADGVARSAVPLMWRVVGVSETGAGHVRASIPCQDAHAFLVIEPAWVAIAVADGAGSAPRAEAGAKLAVRVAVQDLARLFRAHRDDHASGSNGLAEGLGPSTLQAMLAATLIAARMRVEEDAKARSVPPRELACTLMVVLLGPTLVAAAGVGDGAIVVELAGGRLQTLLQPDTGEYEGETTFLTSPGAVERARFAALPLPVESLAAFTDGIQGMVLDRRGWTPHPGFFGKVFDPLRRENDPAAAGEAVRRMLCSDAVRSRTPDDVTLLVATRTGDRPPATRPHRTAS